jgi:hypothetical protein
VDQEVAFAPTPARTTLRFRGFFPPSPGLSQLTSASGKTTIDDERLRAIHAAADGFLRKPCLPGALVDEVRRVLAATGLSEPTPEVAKVPARRTLSRKLRKGLRRAR